MSDSQWPRFEVFQQDRPGKPHRNVGSVHAPDAEIALQNGRDVFVRRPQCHSIWVVPADAILTKTAEELTQDSGWQDEEPTAEAPTETYHVFQKRSQRHSMTYVAHTGTVEARSAVQAMKRALTKFNEGTAVVWWVFPARAVTRSEDDDIESMFAPAETKSYRMPQEYPTVAMMRQIKQAEEEQQIETGNGHNDKS
jgi:ring-1,2-phenylacetyl-CoA epoxidase subunit PaaB